MKLLNAIAFSSLSLAILHFPSAAQATETLHAAASTPAWISTNSDPETLQVAGIGVPSIRTDDLLREDQERLESQLDLCSPTCNSQADIVKELSHVYFELGKYNQAIDLLRHQLQIAQDNNLEQDLIAAIRENLEQNWDFKAAYGIVQNRRLWSLYGNGQLTWHEVESISELNLFVAQIVGDLSRQIDSLHGLGWSARNTASYAESLSLYEEALTLIRNNLSEAEDRDLIRDLTFREFFILTEIGILHADLAQYDKAIGFLEESLEKSILYDETYTAPALHGNIYSNEVFQGFTLYNIGIVHLRRGNSELGLEYFLDVRDNYPPFDGGGLYLNIGNVYFDSGEFDRAAAAFDRASQFVFFGDPGMQGFSLNALGRSLVEMGDYERAFVSFQDALLHFRKLNEPFGESQVLSNLGTLAATQNESELAIVLYKESVNILESIRDRLIDLPVDAQRSYTESISETYRSLADLLLQENRIIEAQRVLDLLKVQELDDYIRGVERTSETETGVAFLRPEATILTRYDDLQASAIAAGQELDDIKAIAPEQRSDEQVQRIAQLTDLLDEINGDFRDFARSPEIRELIGQLSFEAQEASLSLNQLDRLRDELAQLNAAIFYPLILEDRLELVITVPDSPPLRRTVNVSREELNTAILEFRTALTTPSADAQTPAQQLYDWLIRPLEEDLSAAGIETIIYSPDGQLRYIPLAALHDGNDWLIQQYRINNITAESLTDLTDSDTSQPQILAAAYADESLVHMPEVNGKTYTFSGLPGAGLEVDLLPTATKFFDEDFSLEAVRPVLDEYNILHFATHAAFVPGVPEDSFILFGNGDTPTLRDVENWSLNGVDLVVLSACETGVGGLGNGEEILGLGYQFQVSGAKAVMSSLWQVSDLGTQVLMNEFYQALSAGATKAEALQIAQTALISQDAGVDELARSDRGIDVVAARNESSIANGNNGYSHPYYWAPFILIGNGL